MTGRFTVNPDPAIDDFVTEQLQEVTAAVKDTMGDQLTAILLAGGFGRGEGSVAVDEGGAMHVIMIMTWRSYTLNRWASG